MWCVPLLAATVSLGRQHGATYQHSASRELKESSLAFQLGSFDTEEEQAPQDRIGVFQTLRVAGIQPAEHELIDGAEPGVAGSQGVECRQLARGNGVVEATSDQLGKCRMKALQSLAKLGPRSDRLDEQEAGEQAMIAELS